MKVTIDDGELREFEGFDGVIVLVFTDAGESIAVDVCVRGDFTADCVADAMVRTSKELGGTYEVLKDIIGGNDDGQQG